MMWLRALALRFVESGVRSDTSSSDARYIRFLNATLLIFVFAQVPILPLLVSLEMWTQIPWNLAALSLCGLGFALNRSGRYLGAKFLTISVMVANTVYFAILLGATAPTHLWLMAMAVLGVLAFKPSEWSWAAVLVGLTVVSFVALEFSYLDVKPSVPHFTDPVEALGAARASNVSAVILTLILVGMMHQRFATSEAELAAEKAQSDRLLRAILPDEIARELRENGTTRAIRHEDVSLLFADIVGFTPLAASMPAENVVALLATVFERFDRLISECRVEKIKTIGDAYMVAGGVPQVSPDHAHRLARCALGMMEIIGEVSQELGHPLQLRIGLHRGPAVAGVIGTTKFAYDLWGESVNLASRLESSGKPGRIHVSEAFRAGLEEVLSFEVRGEVTLKGVGPTRTYWLLDDRTRRGDAETGSGTGHSAAHYSAAEPRP